MVSSFFISIVVLLLLWVTFATPTIVTSQSSSLESEKEALLKTRWWNTTFTNNVNMSSPWNWLGIACDDGGSVTNIDLPGNELKGSIPQEIGTFSKLTHLNERIPFISPSRTLNYSHKSHTNGESIQQINRIGLILFHSWTKPINYYWILSTNESNLLERISKRNNEDILIMSNNGGMAEITHTVCMCFLMHTSHWLI